MTDYLYTHLNTVTAYSIVLSIALILQARNRINASWAVLSFLMCVLLYLVIDHLPPELRAFLIIGPLLLPFSFWIMARTLFNDTPLHQKRLLTYLILTAVASYGLYAISHYTSYTPYFNVASQALSILFILLAILEAQSGKRTDLDESRIRLRRYFTYFISFMVFITILSELSLSEGDQLLPRLIQRSSILLFNTTLIVLNFKLSSHLFDSRKQLSTTQHPELISRIQNIMVDQKLYRQEKLTIGQLADLLNEQEYKVRRVINQEMGYRNFIDFTNSFRIKEATEMLKNPDLNSLTILEIAYKTGYNSIGPFNRSFKQATGLTPTEYRKKHI
ncbi:helix-turn-helix domain-containing protein [Marinoscillum furvescens]|uniref:Helix-turn-helix protein n=1 Tax=Marinoscillum furvescens DSM 4134 TaxID=1122208 RepID=A0A3D9LGU1_MARFU|nr:helix-turn-helix transcriptional regulator [Marinoscillum furvescens]REE05674.1 helix-turn-helix protein [Marinoscillum furvescens DSM 4134]